MAGTIMASLRKEGVYHQRTTEVGKSAHKFRVVKTILHRVDWYSHSFRASNKPDEKGDLPIWLPAPSKLNLIKA